MVVKCSSSFGSALARVPVDRDVVQVAVVLAADLEGQVRRLLRRDLERLCARRDARAGHGPVAAAALRQGEPVMDSSITLISIERGPIYRGRSAIELAREGRSFEWVAEGLWSGDWRERPEPEGWQPDGSIE